MKGHSQIKSIQIKNLGVIESTNLNFSDGLTVLTGETGAGKTMVLTALSLILGGKADGKLVRNGSERMLVAAEFVVDEYISDKVEELGGSTEDGVLLITRTVSADGKSKATIGGIPTTASTLSELGEELVEIHAQSSSLRLNKESVQRELIDRYANNQALLQDYQTRLNNYQKCLSRLSDLRKDFANRDSEISKLSEIASLVKKFELKENIYEDIDNEIGRLEEVEDLNKGVSTALSLLENEELNALGALQSAIKALGSAANLDRELGLIHSQMADEVRGITAAVSELKNYQINLNADPARFDYLQSRKSELVALAKKFGNSDNRNESINYLLSEAKNAHVKIEDLKGGEDRILQLEKETSLEFANTHKAALALSESRLKAAKEISKEITEELIELALPNAVIDIEVSIPREQNEKNFALHGIDRVEINFASHRSAKLSPLSKSASGGELSRVMLALEVVLSKGSKVGTYIFDEVDAGVGGKAAIEVGRKLAKVAKSSQVLVVTHLPQVAVWANNHIVVEKSDAGDFTESSVFEVKGDRRKVEIARLLSGQEGSESAREHAGELLELVGDEALR
mgnify:FL=1